MIDMSFIQKKKADIGATFEVELGDIGTVEVRKHVDGGTQEAMVHMVAQNMISEDGYYPLRKAALMLTLFLDLYVVGGAELKAEYEDGSVDIYGTYAVLEDELGLMTAARGKCGMLNRELARIENAVDLMVFNAKDEHNAVIASGMATSAGETLEELNALVVSAAGLVNSMSKYWAENQKALTDGIEQIATLNAKLDGVKK